MALSALLAAASGRAADTPAPPPIERRPYAIRVWVEASPAARLSPVEQTRLVARWRDLIGRFVGPAWALEIAPTAGPLLGSTPEFLTAEQVAPLVGGVDKGWFISIEPEAASPGWVLIGREFDAATRQLGSLHRLRAPHRSDAARALFQLSLRVFAPLAEIVRTADSVSLKVQGAVLSPTDPLGAVVREGTVFRPFWILLNPDDSVKAVRPIRYTYLQAGDPSVWPVPAEVVSGLRRPLPQQVAGRYRLLGLGSRAASIPTRLQFHVLRKDDGAKVPYPGAVLTARAYPNGTPQVVGTTGREGEITLPPNYSEGLVVIRVLAGGVEPLREIPILPGEIDEVQSFPVEPKPDAVTLEYRLKAVQDEIVDLIARRGQIEARLEARAEGQQWDDVKSLLDDYRKLPPRTRFEERVKQLEEDAERRQAEQKVPILTQTALHDLGEVKALVLRYLDDARFQAYDEAYQRYLEQKDGPAPAKNTLAGPTLAPPRAAPKATTPPAPAQPKPSAPAAPKPPLGQGNPGGNPVPF